MRKTKIHLRIKNSKWNVCLVSPYKEDELSNDELTNYVICKKWAQMRNEQRFLMNILPNLYSEKIDLML